MRRFYFACLMAILAVLTMAALTTPVKSQDPPEHSQTTAEPTYSALRNVQDETEDYENQKIEDALLEKANKIEDCTVTWYTESTCGKSPDHPAYGITYSGLPVVEHLTCAVDPRVIPLYADVFVEYADGTIEQLWATDTGVKGNTVDIYTPDYDYAIQCGRQSLTVWWVESEVSGN